MLLTGKEVIQIELQESFLQRFKKAMEIRNMKQSDLVLKTGIGKSAISQYATGKYNPKQRALYLLAQALDVSEAWLMGYDVPMEKNNTVDKSHNPNDDLPKEVNLIEQIQNQYGEEAVQLLQCFAGLNAVGQARALESICDLTEIPKYTESEKIYVIKKAARNGSFEEKAITNKEVDEIKNLPDVDDLK